MQVKSAGCCHLLRGIFCLCQYLKDAKLRGHHDGTCERHGYNRIPKMSRYNSCPECDSFKEVLRMSIQSHNSNSSSLISGICSLQQWTIPNCSYAHKSCQW